MGQASLQQYHRNDIAVNFGLGLKMYLVGWGLLIRG